MKQDNKDALVCVLFLCIGLIVGFLFSLARQPEVITQTERIYDCTQMGNFADVCSNFLDQKRVETCGSWREGYMEGHRKAMEGEW